MSIIVIICSLICFLFGVSLFGAAEGAAGAILSFGGIVFILFGLLGLFSVISRSSDKQAIEEAKENYEQALKARNDNSKVESKEKNMFNMGLGIMQQYVDVGLDNIDDIEDETERQMVWQIYNFCISYHKQQERQRNEEDIEIQKKYNEYKKAQANEQKNSMMTGASIAAGVVLGGILSKGIKDYYDKETERLLNRGKK